MLGYLVVLDTVGKSNALYFFDVHVPESFFQQETVHEFAWAALRRFNIAGKSPFAANRNRMPRGYHEPPNFGKIGDRVCAPCFDDTPDRRESF